MDATEKTATDFALLAPVPLVHLISGQRKCEQGGYVAFGSRDSKLFSDLDILRNGAFVDVYIHASRRENQPEAPVWWKARYLRSREGHHGKHPDGMRYRPDTTVTDTDDSAVFWEVTGLEALPKVEWKPMATLYRLRDRKPYKAAFTPRRPLLILHP